MNDQAPIRILLVDDHDMVRKGLSVFLLAYDDFELVGEAVNGKEAIEMCALLQPDVVLMDLMMPVMDGVTAIKAIRENHSHVHIIALTSFSEEKLVEAALKAGAIGYLFKNVSVDELADAIRSASQGLPTLSAEATRILINKTTQPAPPGDNLTDREREVLKYLVEGCSNPEIAKKMSVSCSTVKTHVSHILEKLGVSSRLEAASLAIRLKLTT
jgi:NarL family two-component system response regulator LiaR